MFGFERGAFTDARRSKAGLFQTAHRGTIFLDEVGLLPDTLQAKLLTVLEDQRSSRKRRSRTAARRFEEARRALSQCRARGERGYEAWALHLLAAVGARQETLDSDLVHKSYVSALERAEELGMRPLALRCLLGLARLGERESDVAGAIVHRERARRLGTEVGMSLIGLEA